MSEQLQQQSISKGCLEATPKTQDRDRFAPLPEPDQPMNIEGWRNVINENFPDCAFAAETSLSVAVQLLIKDISTPFGLVLVGEASSGKTTTLSLFQTIEEITYATDNFTPAAIVSHASNRSVTDLKKIDMLPRMRNRIVLVADMAPILAESDDKSLKGFGVMTRLFDGRGYESDSGVHGKRGYKGDYPFMFLACSTPISKSSWKKLGSLGHRLYFLSFDVPDKQSSELISILRGNDYHHKLITCQLVTRNLFLSIWNKNREGVDWDKNSDPLEILEEISNYVKLLCSLRGSVSYMDDEGAHLEVSIEKPLRTLNGIYNLARGHALICGRENLNSDDLIYCWKVVLGSAPKNRVKLIKYLVRSTGSFNSEALRKYLGCSKPTALKEMRLLEALKIVTLTKDADGTVGAPDLKCTIANDFRWLLGRKLEDLDP